MFVPLDFLICTLQNTLKAYGVVVIYIHMAMAANFEVKRGCKVWGLCRGKKLKTPCCVTSSNGVGDGHRLEVENGRHSTKIWRSLTCR